MSITSSKNIGINFLFVCRHALDKIYRLAPSKLKSDIWSRSYKILAIFNTFNTENTY